VVAHTLRDKIEENKRRAKRFFKKEKKTPSREYIILPVTMVGDLLVHFYSGEWDSLEGTLERLKEECGKQLDEYTK